MKERELKDRLERALSNAAPDDVEGSSPAVRCGKEL